MSQVILQRLHRALHAAYEKHMKDRRTGGMRTGDIPIIAVEIDAATVKGLITWAERQIVAERRRKKKYPDEGF